MSRPDEFSYFEKLAATGGWQKGRSESFSGTGSSLEATKVLRPRLADMFGSLGIRTLVDAPCGDMNWMRHLDYPFERFIGIDIAPTLISLLKSQAFPPQYYFLVANVVRDVLPKADAILCRDCLVHLSFEHIFKVRQLWKEAGFRYCFVTTFVNRTTNENIITGGWRPLNMQIAPFNWPEPLAVIDEECQDEGFGDKAIGVWEF